MASVTTTLPTHRLSATSSWSQAKKLSPVFSGGLSSQFRGLELTVIVAPKVVSMRKSQVSCKVKEGDAAPSYTLFDQNGRKVSSSKFRGKNVVFYFFPKADTPGCTKQACSFRDSYTIFKKNGAEVVGVSGDSPEALKEFATKYNLPFTLLSDEGDSVRKEFGVPSDLFGLLPGRQTYVIDKKGIVQLVFNNQFQPEKHIEKTLEILQQ